jgi:glycosyltransferase involved in cell wall biosynthesis
VNIITISYSKTFSDTRVIKYIKFYLEKSFTVTCFGLDDNDNNCLYKNKNFKYESIKLKSEKDYNKINHKSNFTKLFFKLLILGIIFLIFKVINKTIDNLELNLLNKFFVNFNFVLLLIFLFLINKLSFKKRLLFFLKRLYHFYNEIIFFLERGENKKNFDIIHTHDLWTILVALRLKKKFPNAKLIVDLHELYSELPEQNFFHKKFAQIFLLYLKFNKQKIFKFITINNQIKNYYLRKYQFTPIITINNSCPEGDKKNNFKININEILKNLKKERKKILMYHGGISLNRGVIEICKFFTECEIKDWVFYIMGSGKGTEQIKELIDQNIKNNIFLTNSVKLYELQHYSSFADMGLINYKNNCLNHNYCTPNKLWEYSRASLPMLLSNCTSFIELNKKYNFGKIIDDKNYDGLQKVFLNLTNEELQKLSANSRNFYMKENWEVEKKKIDREILFL